MRRFMLPLSATLAASVAFAQHDHGHGHTDEHSAEIERRELGTHVHGRGAVSMAFEGGAIAIALEAPGMDIVGFEHTAASDADRAAIAAAKARLADPLSLFVLPAAADCTVSAAAVTLLGYKHDDHGHADNGQDGHGHEARATHTEFQAEYALACARPGRIDAIRFAYFDAFANARSLTVMLASANGQSSADVTREDPVLALDGAM